MRARVATATAVAVALATLATLATRAHAEANPVLRFAVDTLVYADSDRVLVVSPQAAVHGRLDRDGGEASARVVLDVISAASVDVVSHATPRFQESRTEVDLAVSKRFGPWLPSAHYRNSSEPDYSSNDFGAAIERRLHPDATLSASYDLSLDEVGRSGTSLATWSRGLTTHTAEVSLTQVVGPRTLLRGVYTLTAQTGYQEKPYRYVPLFTPDVMASNTAAGVTLDLGNFDDYRQAERPPEEVPELRIRHAFGLRLLRYLGAIHGSLRADYRFYADSWSLLANSLESELAIPIGKTSRLSLRGRVHQQTGAFFWHRAYVTAPGDIPRWRTMDRDLSPYVTLSSGARYELGLGDFGLYADLEGTYTRYLDYMFLDSRVALIGQLGVRYPR